MSLSPFDLFGTVVSSGGPTDVGRLDALRVDHGRRGARCASGFDPGRAPERIAQASQKSALAPPAEVIVDGLPRGEVVRQHSPLATAFEQVKQGVENLARGVFLEGALSLKERFDKFPLRVRQVGAICFLHSGLGEVF
jgi:hypothetical protein